ncbi:MAG: type I glyceraldehyde-3-phosphate dehydrogenase [Peptococcaceae bacterium]|nr:type I glyceraldehyde-3-phosphate dehydrogenase [Peptococcaceae bacterium]
MTVRVGINGFGRIGRCMFRIALNRPELNVIAVNDLGDPATLAHLLQYDSVHGNLTHNVTLQGDTLYVDEKEIKLFGYASPDQIPWKEIGVDIVVEATGKFRTYEGASKHLAAGAEKVVVSAPVKGGGKTIVMGVNEDEYQPDKHQVLSCASCTTNCLAPLASVLHGEFGIVSAMVSTIHSYTNDQRLLDSAHKDLRRARAAALSIVPTTTGAARTVALVAPEFKGLMDGLAFRVPTPVVSVLDFVMQLQQPVSRDEVNRVLREASAGRLKGIVSYVEAPLVSRDIIGNHHSSIVDGLLTMSVGSLVKVVAWYDNEWGYANRVIDLVSYIGHKGS